MHPSSTKDEDIFWFIAVNIRWSIILGSICSLVVVIIIPFPTMGDPFTLEGEGTDAMNAADITKVKLMACGILGLLTNGLLIAIYEQYTSHGGSYVKHVANSSVPRLLTMNIVFSSFLGGFVGYLTAFIFALLMYLCIGMAGYAGLMYFTGGYLSMLFVKTILSTKDLNARLLSGGGVNR